jgi:hypothetical protein
VARIEGRADLLLGKPTCVSEHLIDAVIVSELKEILDL